MNKKIVAAVLAVSAALSVSSAVMADDDIKVVVNGNEVAFTDAAPFIEGDRTLVPMRAIFEALGASVNWDEETKTIVSYDPVSDVSITMQIDLAKMFVDETEVELDVPARIVNSSTVVPLRAVAESMNSTVGWDQTTKTVTVEKNMGN
ncbi:MAG: copper amine oxidase N-terminal domain-containing protein [Oscillospiraceae bacterium]|nr:copper amine oxidase N-terminal domain-containing protein [Oscillospiraceae bacterium]